MQIINGLIQIFMGAVSGYYTNKLAISHLFTDIPLFGNRSWKAVIKKGGNKERLAEDLSEIAEDKILGNSSERNSYLYQELSKEEVLHSLDQCVLAVFEELEQGETAQTSLVTVLREFLTRDQEKEILENVLETICSEWRLRDVISERAFTDFCMENFGKESFSEKFSLALSKETVTKEAGSLC